MKPLIRRSNLTEPPTYWALTKYTVGKHGMVESQEKYDVSDDLAPFLAEAVQQGRDEAKAEAEARIAAVLKDTRWLTRLQRRLGIVR